MPRLTVRQKNRIIAEYVDGDGRVTQAQLAQKYNCTQKTISKILSDTEVREKVLNAKNNATLSMLEYIKARTDRVQHLIDIALDSCDEQLEKAPLRDKTGAIKILIEKFFSSNEDNYGLSNISVDINIRNRRQVKIK